MAYQAEAKVNADESLGLMDAALLGLIDLVASRDVTTQDDYDPAENLYYTRLRMIPDDELPENDRHIVELSRKLRTAIQRKRVADAIEKEPERG